MEETKTVVNLDNLLQFIPKVSIDNNGVYKYILIKAQIEGQENNAIFFVRGTVKREFHADILDLFKKELKQSKKFSHVDNNNYQGIIATIIENNQVSFECVGGGRIEHSQENKKIFIYGYSQSFGQAQHQISMDLIIQQYKEYPKENFSWSNEGY